MGADIKALRTRIKSVDSTLHLTKAMGLVASSKIRRSTGAMMRGREYAAALEDAVATLTASMECRKSPYMQTREGGKTKIIIIAGDRGLAGGYNANVFRLARNYPDAEFLPIGKRACERYGGGEFLSAERFSGNEASHLAGRLCEEFAAGAFDRLGILSTEYVSIMTQEPKIRWILPLTAQESEKSTGMVFEPDEISILNTTVPLYVAGLLVAAVRESFACEIAARRMAMDSAGKNAGEMIANLQLAYNRARQSTITQEITEIVAGSGT